jgi:hypothetical protein
VDAVTNAKVAIKVEPATNKKQLLKLEIAILKKLQGQLNLHFCHTVCVENSLETKGNAFFCKLYGYGRSEAPPARKESAQDTHTTHNDTAMQAKIPIPINFIVMQLLGQNLSEIRKERKPDPKFSIATTGKCRCECFGQKMSHMSGLYVVCEIKY